MHSAQRVDRRRGSALVDGVERASQLGLQAPPARPGESARLTRDLSSVERGLHKAVECGGRKEFVICFAFFQFSLVIFSLLEEDKGSFLSTTFHLHEALSCLFPALLFA
jgi:hypothetical protein